jgi:diguanylate cyclase (GGDEF)-like protein
MNSQEDVLFLVVLAFSVLAIAAANLKLRKDEELADVLSAMAELEMVERVAVTDWLTGQKNRRGVAQAIEEADVNFQSVVMFDLDGLKKINDSLGHKVGDVYVKTITSRIAANFNQDDIFGRWGGDEFVAILPLNEEQAVTVVERVIDAVHSTPIVTDGLEIEARVSAGIAPWEPNQDLDATLAKADEALYGAKAQGGSRALGYTKYLNELSSRSTGAQPH